MSTANADLILTNARVRTMASMAAGPLGPPPLRPDLVAVRGGRILHVGRRDDLEMLRGPNTRVVDCQGTALLPSFIDAHLHLFAYAAALRGVDCSPRAVASIAELQAAIRHRVEHTLAGAWIRAWGFEEFHLKERRPTRWDLDQAAPQHPVKLVHRSGHASVLNSAALARLGIDERTPEPPGGLIERDLATGKLTGYFLEMEHDLEARGAPTLTPAELENAVLQAARCLFSLGITAIHEATPSRALEHWELLCRLKERGHLPLRVTKMVAPSDLPELRRRGLAFGSGDDGLRIGAVKVMLNETGQRVLPEADELRRIVHGAHQAGFQLACHAAERRGIEAAADAIEGALREQPRPDHRHRIEHCGVCPPALVRRLAGLGAVVVSQPAFVAESGDRYLAQVPKAEQPWLYPFATLRKAGVRLAFGSDGPHALPGPLRDVYTAHTRHTRAGGIVAPNEVLPVDAAVAACTREAAYAGFQDGLGRIAEGAMADLVLLDRDPLDITAEELPAVAVERVWIGGVPVYGR